MKRPRLFLAGTAWWLRLEFNLIQTIQLPVHLLISACHWRTILGSYLRSFVQRLVMQLIYYLLSSHRALDVYVLSLFVLTSNPWAWADSHLLHCCRLSPVRTNAVGCLREPLLQILTPTAACMTLLIDFFKWSALSQLNLALAVWSLALLLFTNREVERDVCVVNISKKHICI